MKPGIQLLFPWRGRKLDLPPLSWPGRIFLALSAVVFCCGLIFVNEASIRVSLFCLLVIALARPLSAANMRRLSYAREAPELVCQKEDFPFRMVVRNDKPVADTFDVAVEDEFARRKLPDGALFDAVPARCETMLDETTRVSQRGLLGPFRYAVSSDFPFGIVDNRVENVLPDMLAVYPAPLLPAVVRNLLDSDAGQESRAQMPSRDVSGEFRSLREYQYGDHVKLISWPVSARLSRLIVKETETTSPSAVTIIHHSCRPRGVFLTPKSFEKSLHILSGLIHYFHAGSSRFCFVPSFNGWTRMTVAADPVSFHEAMRTLAVAKMDHSNDKDALKAVIRKEAESSAMLIVVSNTPMNHWQDVLAGLGVNAICMDNRSVRIAGPGEITCA
jgi:uncharacterized protein (DUF58 family)